jgi:hypothetical protein
MGADAPAGGEAPTVDWPVPLAGVTETVVTTPGPDGDWQVAALGVEAPAEPGAPATARTWADTRTRRAFAAQGMGYVQFTRDALDFATAALEAATRSEPVLASATAWARVDVTRRAAGTEDGTEWVAWCLWPREATVREATAPPLSRALGAVVEMTVAVSRLGVAGYDEDALRDRLAYFETVVERCGGDRELAALSLVREHADW